MILSFLGISSLHVLWKFSSNLIHLEWVLSVPLTPLCLPLTPPCLGVVQFPALELQAQNQV